MTDLQFDSTIACRTGRLPESERGQAGRCSTGLRSARAGGSLAVAAHRRLVCPRLPLSRPCLGGAAMLVAKVERVPPLGAVTMVMMRRGVRSAAGKRQPEPVVRKTLNPWWPLKRTFVRDCSFMLRALGKSTPVRQCEEAGLNRQVCRVSEVARERMR